MVITNTTHRSIAARGVDATRQRWESHWSSALSGSDIDFLVNTARCTSIRLPIGYFTLGAKYTVNTPFAGTPSQIYTSAWTAVQNLCSRLHSAGIGTLVDFHALPGGANGEEHSGTSSGRADLWGNRSNLELAKNCILFIASEVASGKVPGCIGIQLCNEAVYGAAGMYEWYSDIIRAVSQIDASIPLYISDAWDLNTALSWSAQQNSVSSPTNSIVVDTHKYYTFSEADRAQSPQQIIARIPSELNEVAGKSGSVVDRGAAQAVVGEWSCVLDGSTWAKAQGANRDDLVRQFGNAQCYSWREKSAGSFFWTAKMDWMDGGEWGFFEMTKKGAVVPPPGLELGFEDVKARISTATQQWQDLKARAVQVHVEYWNRTSPGVYFEHWRFEQGWDVGFSDALTFFGMRVNGGIEGGRNGGDRIGGLELWVRKRLRESGTGGGFVWEWEQGFRQGVGRFEGLVGL